MSTQPVLRIADEAAMSVRWMRLHADTVARTHPDVADGLRSLADHLEASLKASN